MNEEDEKDLPQEDLKIGDVNLSETWRGAKRVDNWKDPFDVGAAAAANTIEFMVPQSNEEWMMEMTTLGQGKKLKLGRKLINAGLQDVSDIVKKTDIMNKTLGGASARLRGVRSLFEGNPFVKNIGTGLEAKLVRLKGVNTLSPNGLQNWGSTADIKRKSGARFISGIDNEPAFIQAGWDVLDKLNKSFGIDITRATAPFQIHHKGVIRQVAESANGLTDEAARLAGDLISKKVGFKLGYAAGNASPLPPKFHQRVHDIINDSISGKWGDNLEGLIDKRTGLALPRDWQLTMDLQARIDAGIYDQIADAINESTKAIDTFWKGVSTRTNLGNLSSDEFIDATFEVLEADDMLTALRRTRNPSPDKIGYNITDAVNELLERAGRIDLQSPIFEKLDPDMSKGMVKILLQRNGAKALQEVLTSKQSPATVFKAYGIKTKGYDTLFKQLNLPGFTNIKDPTGGKPLGRPKGSKDIKKRKKNKNVNQTEGFVEWNEKDYNDLIYELKNILEQ